MDGYGWMNGWWVAGWLDGCINRIDKKELMNKSINFNKQIKENYS